MKKYEKALPYSVDMVIPGYEKSYPQGIFRTLAISKRDSIQWYLEFLSLLESAIGTRYLPICRLSDGEFIFCLGRILPPIRRLRETMLEYVLRVTSTHLAWLLKPSVRKFRNGDTTIPSGIYSTEEWKNIRKLYPRLLHEISKVGILGLHFSYRNNQFAQQYFVPMVKWLKKNDLQLSDSNYYPFYFVYALLNGPDRARILGRDRILVVTHCDENKSIHIEKNLKEEGAKSVQFIQVSQNRSMYDKIDLSKIKLPVDVVLVGAGLGKPNVLLQLRKTNTLCIDAGFVIECLAHPGFRRSKNGARTFCWADFERNGDYTPI